MNTRELQLFKSADASIRGGMAGDLIKLTEQWERANYGGMRHTIRALRQRLETIEKTIPPGPDNTMGQPG